MNQCLQIRVEHLVDRIRVTPLVEVVTDPQALQVLVTVELVVVVERDWSELLFIFRHEDGHRIPPEVGARHRHNMSIRTRHDFVHHLSQPTGVLVGRHVVELVDCHKSVIKSRGRKLRHRKTQRRVGANQHCVVTFKETQERVNLAAVPSGSAQVVAIFYLPVRKEPVLYEGGAGKRGANGTFWNSDDDLVDSLMEEFVEGDEHECPGLPRCRRCFYQQVLRILLSKYAALHVSHPKFVDIDGALVGRIVDLY